MEILSPVLLAVAGFFALLAVGFVVAARRAVRGRGLLSASVRSLTALLFAAVAALCVTLTAATLGYRGFTREDLAARVHVTPVGPQSFDARFVYPDGREARHRVAGDQLYVDAHILKWKPFATVLGLHTAYELDRVTGRYASLDDERARPRTVFSIASPKRLDLFHLRRKHAPLRFLVDAEYGSATFIEVRKPAVFEIRVSTSGLLVREIR